MELVGHPHQQRLLLAAAHQGDLLLHRLAFLEVPLARRTEGGDDRAGMLFREVWRLQWTPEVEPGLEEIGLARGRFRRAIS